MILSTAQKDQVLKDLASLIADHQEDIIAENQKDLEQTDGLDPTLIDRLKVDEKKVAGMVSAIEEVIGLEDPQGKILNSYDHPNGMTVDNRVVPFGKILIIYESRPDVTIEAAISAFKAGNKILLKGGKEAKHSNLYLVKLWKEALSGNDVEQDAVEYLDIDRETTQKLLAENTHKLDLIIPRGGDGLINYIKNNTSVPVIISGRGNNFIYVHKNADLDMALNLILNGKSRLSVCNAVDKVLFHREIPGLDEWVDTVLTGARSINLDVQGDGDFFSKRDGVTAMSDESMYAEEFLSPKILFGLVENMEEAIQKINEYSGGHSGVIVSSDDDSAEEFLHLVDCAAVYHNASTRFTDGGQFGFGAEIAISTQKLHFRGPVGLAQLVTNKWFISGQGQVR
ncbi:MAG: glutamate-5-semialdehyde dehydrogenase [Reichenbachiella sp.]